MHRNIADLEILDQKLAISITVKHKYSFKYKWF